MRAASIASSTSRTKAARRSRPTSHALPASARRRPGPARSATSCVLYGAIAPDATRVRAVHARFPGVIRAVSRNVGDAVRSGETLATIESNESLQTYTVTAPDRRHRHRAPRGARRADRRRGAVRDRGFLVGVGRARRVLARPRTPAHRARRRRSPATTARPPRVSVDYLAPVGNRASQSVTARVVSTTPTANGRRGSSSRAA